MTAGATTRGLPESVDGADTRSLVNRVHGLLDTGARVIVGLTGPPGVGKSTVSAALIEHCEVPTVIVPFDGFHLSNPELSRLGRLDRKGAIDTFDIAGYRVLLRRLASAEDEIVYAPTYRREIEESIGGSIAVPPETRLIITEGNYLLVAEAGIDRALFDEVWYLDLDDDVRLQRLIDRHEQFGKPRAEARRWAIERDEANARLIRSTRSLADVIVQLH